MGRKTSHPGVERVAHGRYRLRATWTCSKTGRRREIDRVVLAASATEASAKRAQLLAGAAGETEPLQRMRFAAYAKSWLAEKAPTVTVATSKWYAHVLTDYILPTFGEHYIDAIERRDVVAWRDGMEDEPATVNGRLRVMRTVMRDASRVLGIADPTANVKPVAEGDPKRKALTLHEMRSLLAALQDAPRPWHTLALTMAYTGMRFGEATALRWDDIGDVIVIRRSQWRGNVGKTKTKRVRSVAVPRELAEALREHRAWLLREQHKGLPTGYVFTSGKGTLLSNTGLRKALVAAAKRAKLGDEPTPHWFRHTFNNLVRQHAAGEVVRSMTGHSTEAMTEHYSHIGAHEKLAAVTRALGLTAECGDRSGDGAKALDAASQES